MATKDFLNLIVATGLSAASASMNFQNSMPSSPLPAGRSMRNYSINSLTNNSQSFNVNTPIRNYTNIKWHINTVVDVTPNQINDLLPKSSSITISNVLKGDGSANAGNVGMTNPIYTYSAFGVTASCAIESFRTVSDYTGASNVNAYDTFTITVRHKTDDSAFNDIQDILVDDVKIRPIFSGQGGPFSQPAPPVSLNSTYPAPGDNQFVLFTVALSGWIAADLDYEVQWSIDNFVNTVSGDNTGTVYFVGPFAAGNSGLSIDMYARARVINPYISPWSTSVSLNWTDPRPP
jgi:hypothetical protein